MVIKKFGDFSSSSTALTLQASEVTGFGSIMEGNLHQKTHIDGWTIKAKVEEDWFLWVNYFEANHPIHGRVWGDFEDEVFADTEEGFNHFYANHTPEQWDYYDI